MRMLIFDAEPDDAKHLLINCALAKEVYRLIWSWFGLRGNATPCLSNQGPVECLENNATMAAGILLYSWWNVWKEKNKRVFKEVQRSELHVAMATKDDIDLLFRTLRF
jgi:hypothetical protein